MKEGIKILKEIERQVDSVSFELIYHLIGGVSPSTDFWAI